MPTREQLREGAAAGREAVRDMPQSVILLGVVGALLGAWLLRYAGLGFWPSLVVAAVAFGVAIGVYRGIKLRRAMRARK
jgi:hypothetical protein